MELTPYELWQLERYGNYIPEIENLTATEAKLTSTEESYIYLLENPPQC